MLIDRKSTRLNSIHLVISYAVFCLKKKTKQHKMMIRINYRTGSMLQCRDIGLATRPPTPCLCSSRLARALSFPSAFFFFFNDTATTEIYTLSLHDALPI